MKVNPYELQIQPGLYVCGQMEAVYSKAIELGSFAKMIETNKKNPGHNLLAEMALESNTGNIFTEGSFYLFITTHDPELNEYFPGMLYYRIPDIVENLHNGPGLLVDQLKRIMPDLTADSIKEFVEAYIGKPFEVYLN